MVRLCNLRGYRGKYNGDQNAGKFRVNNKMDILGRIQQNYDVFSVNLSQIRFNLNKLNGKRLYHGQFCKIFWSTSKFCQKFRGKLWYSSDKTK